MNEEKEITVEKVEEESKNETFKKKLRGVGYTRKDKSQTKKAKKLAKLQRKVNHKRANKKFRATGSKRK